MQKQLEKELRFHLDQHAGDVMARGATPEEARREARRALGGQERVKEKCRDAILALGMDASTVMFTVVNSVVLQPLSFPEAQRLVTVHGFMSSSASSGVFRIRTLKMSGAKAGVLRRRHEATAEAPSARAEKRSTSMAARFRRG